MAWWSFSKKSKNTYQQQTEKQVKIDATADIFDTSASCFNKTVSLSSALDLEVLPADGDGSTWIDGEAFNLPSTLWHTLGDAIALRRYYGLADLDSGILLPSNIVEVDFSGDDGLKVKVNNKIRQNAKATVLSSTGLKLGVKTANLNAVVAENKLLKTAREVVEEFVKFGRIVSVDSEAPPKYIDKVKDEIAKARNGQDIVLRSDTEITRFNDETLSECLPPETIRTLRQGVCGAWLVPYDLVYTDSSNRASVEVARDSFLRDTLYPDACIVCAAFGDWGLENVKEIRPKRLARQEVAGAQAQASTQDGDVIGDGDED